MQKKSMFSLIAGTFAASPAPADVVKQAQAMLPLSEREIMAVAGGPEVINDPRGPE